MRPFEAYSYSALNQLLRVCGLQFFFQRVEGLEPDEESSNLILGSAIHHAHAFLRVQQKRGERVVLDDAKQVFAESLATLAEGGLVHFEEGEFEEKREAGLGYVDLLHANLS